MSNHDIVDIGESPWEFLSNFMAYCFVFRGFEMASMEGFLQSLKFPLLDKQCRVMALTGIKAKRKGQKKKWYLDHVLYWQGQPIDRFSSNYIEFVEDAFLCMFEQNEQFRQALLATGTRKLIHSRGKANPKYTILTEDEFVSILYRLRNGEIKAKLPKKHKTTGRFDSRNELVNRIFSFHDNSSLSSQEIAKNTTVSVVIVNNLLNSLEHWIWRSIDGNVHLKKGQNPEDFKTITQNYKDMVKMLTKGTDTKEKS